jgi:FkbM family methyltransferase
MTRLLNLTRRALGRAQRELWPSAEEASLRHARDLAGRTPRHTPGSIRFGRYQIEYGDLMSVWPQWSDIFLEHSLRFAARNSRHRRVLDCGANVGLASLYFKALYPRARVTAFEADPALAAICRRNLDANGCRDVTLESAAVWTDDGTVEFFAEGGDSGMLAAVGEPGPAPLQRVRSLRLRNYLEHEPIDLLKLDVEGAELPVLRDCADLLSQVGLLILDLHEFDPSSRQTAAIFNLLDAAGFRYSLTHLSPLPGGTAQATLDRFPGVSARWAVLLHAWRPEGTLSE